MTNHAPSMPSKDSYEWDDKVRGLALRTRASGRRTWILQWWQDGRARRLTLGDATAINLTAARKAAQKAAGDVANGGNPIAEKAGKRASARISALVESYLDHAREELKPRSYEEVQRHLRQHAKPIHTYSVKSLDRTAVSNMLDKVASSSGAVTANRTRSSVRAMLEWACNTGRAETNPAARTVKRQEKSRERVLSDAEIKALWAATDNWQKDQFSRIVRLLLATGCRRDEIGGLLHSEVGTERITIGAARMKGGVAHEIPMLPLIAKLLPAHVTRGVNVFGRLGTGFSGWSRCKARLDKKAGVTGWTLHDLRRTMDTRLHDAGVAPHIVEALLAHQVQGVAAVYNRASFRQAKAEALQVWHGLLVGIIGA
jgi:integrase